MFIKLLVTWSLAQSTAYPAINGYERPWRTVVEVGGKDKNKMKMMILF